MFDNWFKSWEDEVFKYEKVKKNIKKILEKVSQFNRDAWHDITKNFKWDDDK